MPLSATKLLNYALMLLTDLDAGPGLMPVSVCIASSIASPHRVTLLVTIRDREPSLVTLGPDTGSLGVRL